MSLAENLRDQLVSQKEIKEKIFESITADLQGMVDYGYSRRRFMWSEICSLCEKAGIKDSYNNIRILEQWYKEISSYLISEGFKVSCDLALSLIVEW